MQSNNSTAFFVENKALRLTLDALCLGVNYMFIVKHIIFCLTADLPTA